MGEYLNKEGLTRFKEKMLTEVDKRIATGGGSTSGGDVPSKEEILEGATRVTDVEVNSDVATIEALQTSVARVESNLDSKLNGTTIHIVEAWSDGTNWYRKWSNGWIEQGGIGGTSNGGAVTFPTPFQSAVHGVLVQTNYATTSAKGNNVGNVTLTGFKSYCDVTQNRPYYYACGY